MLVVSERGGRQDQHICPVVNHAERGRSPGAYAQAYPDRVSELILMATTLTSPDAVEWITETVGRLFPVEWDVFRTD